MTKKNWLRSFSTCRRLSRISLGLLGLSILGSFPIPWDLLRHPSSLPPPPTLWLPHFASCLSRLQQTLLSLNWYSADLPLATRRTPQRLGLQYLTETQAKFLRVLPWWRRRIFQALEESRDTLAKLCESQRKSAEKLLRKKFHWLFAHGKKGIQQILGKRKPPSAMEFVTQTCPCGIQWTMDGSNSSASVQQWVLDVTKWLDPTRYTLHVEIAKVSITARVLTDLYPMIQCCLQSPSFPAGGPPTLLHGQGPWSGENLCTA